MEEHGSDWELSRREFLEQSAYAAGLAGAATLPASTILAEAAKASHRGRRLPRPRNVEIDHFVILMMENRSFDHYFGWLTNEADGVQHQSFRNPAGQQVGTRHASSLGAAEWQGCGHPDPGHGWDEGRAQLGGGFLANGSGNDEFALCYYNRGEIPFIHAAARQYTLYDRYFCSLLSSTWPNRYYKWSGQSGGFKTNTLQVPNGNSWETIFDRATAHGLTVRYYASDLPFAATFGPRAVAWINPIERYYTDCLTGNLPNIAIVDPPFKDGGGGDGLSADEHPLGDVRLGQAFMADVVNAFVNSKNYQRGALFVIYDEWGGFFDHVRPPRVPDDRASNNPENDFGQMGFRVPAVAVSPYARRGKKKWPWERDRYGWHRNHFEVDHGLYGHESILKFISYRFGLGDLNTRMKFANNIGRSFDFWRPDFERPQLPDPPEIVTQPCAAGGGDVLDSQQAHASDLADIEHVAERYRLPVYDGKLGDIFTLPDSVKKGILSAPR
jgi:phospholipase C